MSLLPKVPGFGSKGYKHPTTTATPKHVRGPRSRGAALLQKAEQMNSAGASGSAGKAAAAAAAAAASAAPSKNAAKPSKAVRRLLTSVEDDQNDEEDALTRTRQQLGSSAADGPRAEAADDAASVGIRAPLGPSLSIHSSPSQAVITAQLQLDQRQQERERYERQQRLDREEREAERKKKIETDRAHREAIANGSMHDPARSLFDNLRRGTAYYSGPLPGSGPAAYTKTSYRPNSGLGSQLYSSSSSSRSISSFFSPSSPWRSTSPSLHLPGGFRNVGNSCYMNAVLQALLGLPSFHSDLTTTHLADTKPRPPARRSLPQHSCFNMLLNLAMERTMTRYGGIDTNDLKRSFGARNNIFSGYQQQDAHEFLCACLTFIHDDVEHCLLTEEELAQREEERRKWAAPPPPRKPAAATAAAATIPSKRTSQAKSDSSIPNAQDPDPFDFDLDEPTGSPAPAAAAAATNGARSPGMREESKTGATPASALTVDDVSVTLEEWNSEVGDEVVIAPSQPDDAEADTDEQMGERKEGDDTGPTAAADAAAANAVTAEAGVAVPPAQSSSPHTAAGKSEGDDVAAAAVVAAPVSPPVPPPMSAERVSELTRQLNELSPVGLNFSCELGISLVCQKCGLTRKVHEAYHDLSLDLPSKPTPSIKPKPPQQQTSDKLKTEASFSFDGHDARNSGAAASASGSASSAAAAAAVSQPAASAASSNAFTTLLSSDQSTPVLHLSHLVRNYFEPRMAEYRCECSPDMQQLKQSFQLAKLPRVLILHLKRFQPNMRTGMWEKRQENVKFEQSIDLTEYVADDVETPPSNDAASTLLAAPSMPADASATASPSRVERKRKAPPTAPTSNGSAASARSLSPTAKHPRLNSPSAIKLKREKAARIQAVTQEHANTCNNTNHDNCESLALERSKCDADYDEGLRELKANNLHVVDESAAPSSPAAAASAPTSPAPVAKRPQSPARDADMLDAIDDDEDAEFKKALAESLAVTTQQQQQAKDEEEALQQALKASLNDTKPPAQPAPPAASKKPRMRHTYELLSVVIHKGVSLGSGHYVTQIREEDKKEGSGSVASAAGAAASSAAASSSSSAAANNNSKPSKVWKQYDDSRVTKLSDYSANDAAVKEGYIFFYSYKPVPYKPAAARRAVAAPATGKKPSVASPARKVK